MMSAATRHSSRAHWPEYLIEGWALGMFMISAGVFATALDYPGSPLHSAIADGNTRRALVGIAMGLTAIALIYSPWGKRSGAHMNPAITLAFLRLKHVARWDAAFYILAQFIGGTLGVLLVRSVLGDAFAQPPVAHVATLPAHGTTVALCAEFGISFLMMTMVLRVSNSERYMRYTGFFAGVLVALFISFEAPLLRHEHESGAQLRLRISRRPLWRTVDLLRRARPRDAGCSGAASEIAR